MVMVMNDIMIKHYDNNNNNDDEDNNRKIITKTITVNVLKSK